MRTAIATAIATTVLAAGLATAGTVSTEAFSNATVNGDGVRFADYFFNVQGAANGNFASYGVATFDGAVIAGQLDAQFGAGNWQIDNVSLALVQSNAGFTTDGLVNVHYTDNDDLGLQNPGASNPTYADGAALYSDAQLLASYNFNEVSSGHTDTIDLGAAAQIAGDIASGDLVSLYLYEGDANVAATWAGHNNDSYTGPTLIVDASVIPAPGTALLLGLGALVSRRRR